MTIRQALRARRRRGLSVIASGIALLIVAIAALNANIGWLFSYPFIGGMAAMIGGTTYVMIARCPSCDTRLGRAAVLLCGTRSSRKRSARFCPYCGVDVD